MYKSATPMKIHKDILPGSKKIYCRFFLFSFLFFSNAASAQDSIAIYAKDTKASSRDRLYKSLVNNAITKNLSVALTDSTEEYWIDAFNAIQLIRYKSPWADSRIYEAYKGVEKRSDDFQRALLGMSFAIYPGAFTKEIIALMNAAVSDRVFAVCAEYIAAAQPAAIAGLKIKTAQRKVNNDENAILKILSYRLDHYAGKNILPPIKEMLQQPFFKNAVLVYSFQRKNRNYPGIALVRDTTGNFVKGLYTDYFYVPQLARSVTNLPGYISNGNTPQGIFRMDGFAVSKNIFIGPTANIQLTMPAETSIQHFMNDSSITDTVWTEDWYKKLLPQQWKNYIPVYESYYAGKAGRTEIIAHGTTINPAYYKGQPYYPLTPTYGCLCTKEIWNEEDGKRAISDQQLLVNAIQQAGGANGYCIVIELNDDQRPVTIEDILPFLK
jgi:hypothetical protein